MNVEKLPIKRKQELLSFLAEAMFDKRIRMKPHHDKALGFFSRELFKNKGKVVNVKVPLIVLTFANTTWEALVTQNRRYFVVTEVTDKGVYGVACDIL